jgi:hypothetical protein
MSCNCIEGIVKTCDNNIGGIKKLWLWDIKDQTNIGEDLTGWTISALTVSSGTCANPIQEYEFIRNGSNYIEETLIDLDNGSTYVNDTLNLIFTRREAAKSKSLKILSEGQRYLAGIVLDNNGLYWYFSDLQLSATGEGSGTAKGDGSKYSVTLVGGVKELAKEVSASNVALLLANLTF